MLVSSQTRRTFFNQLCWYCSMPTKVRVKSNSKGFWHASQTNLSQSCSWIQFSSLGKYTFLSIKRILRLWLEKKLVLIPAVFRPEVEIELSKFTSRRSQLQSDEKEKKYGPYSFQNLIFSNFLSRGETWKKPWLRNRTHFRKNFQPSDSHL